MTERLTDGQDALRLLARAARALVEERTLSTDGLLPAYRALAPLSHELAGADIVDVTFIARCRALGGDALLSSSTVRAAAASPRAPLSFDGTPKGSAARPSLAAARDSVVGDALALALGLSLEAAKLRHGLSAPADLLRAAFATPADAKRALEALAAGGATRHVDVTAFAEAAPDRVGTGKLATLSRQRPTYVVVGAGGRRVHDLLSPFARRLRAELAAVAGVAGAGGSGAGPAVAASASRADDVYAGIAALYANASDLDEERFGVEGADGFDALGPGALGIRCEALVEGEVDTRVREAATSLKRSRALVVCVEERASSLAAVLAVVGASCRAVVIIVEASDDATPTFVVEPASDHVCALDNALADRADASGGCSLTLPSFALRPRVEMAAFTGTIDDALFPLATEILRARASGVLPHTAKCGLRTTRAADNSSASACAIDLLGRLGPKETKQRR